jgi:acyl-CoA synthetase (AMP-forming)/AMP-acid ligase II/carbon monoxide dehydrogenase subunit G
MRVEQEAVVDASCGRVWEVIKDPARYPELLPGITTCEPEDPERDPGSGARYLIRYHVGAAEVGARVEIVEYDPARDISWTSITGIEQRAHLRLRDPGDGRTRLELRFSYGAPGPVFGTLAELASRGEVSRLVRRWVQGVKAEAEGTEMPALGSGPGLAGRLVHEAGNVWILARAGIVAPMRPDKVARIGLAAARWGASVATGVVAGAVRHPQRPMLIDELGTLTYGEVDERTNAIANGLLEAGVGAGDRVGLMCRDHRGFVEAAAAVGKIGADVLLLNTSFAGPQLTEVMKREEAVALIYDEEFEELVREAGRRRLRFVGWVESDDVGDQVLEELAVSGQTSRPPRPPRTGRVTILTSGTTGTPKGASRQSTPLTLDPPAALLERIPMHQGQMVRIAAPLFHAWGFANFALGMGLGSTFVLRRRFNPEQCLADIGEHRCDVLVVVPVMLQRILALPEEERDRYDTSSLRCVCASGSALPGELAEKWMDAFGDNLYNMYGTTEVAAATLARPRDLRAAPGTAGKPTRGTIVRVYSEGGRPLPQGLTGRIFVGNAMLFEGYTGGGSKDQLDGLMATGDVGYFDPAGRLFVRGRDDEMIVSGGENVYPKEVEDVLARHKAVAEAACIGVDDEQFGQRLRAFVVLADGRKASEDELKDWVKSNLARYKVPREVVFMDALPRNPTGKVLKRELAETEDSEEHTKDGGRGSKGGGKKKPREREKAG